MKKQLIQFLKDNNALIPFCVNLAKYNKISISQLIKITKDPVQLISRAFIWYHTPERDFYWSELERTWLHSLLK